MGLLVNILERYDALEQVLLLNTKNSILFYALEFCDRIGPDSILWALSVQKSPGAAATDPL